MRRAAWFPRVSAPTLVVLGMALAAGSAQGAEEARRFLEGLRERGYFDTALDYLESVRDNPLVDKEFKQAIDYEAGATLIDDSRVVREMSLREKRLGEARERFNRFLTEFPNHPLAASARNKMADLLVERGRIKVEQAEKPSRTAEQRRQLLEEGRTLFQEAEKVFTVLEATASEELKKYPKGLIRDPDSEQRDKRDQVRRDLLQSRLALGTVMYETSKTYPEGSENWKNALQESAKRYEEMYKKYGTKLAGLYALMWGGRCYKELGDTDQAFKSFEECLSQPNEPEAFRVMKNKAAMLALETALMPKVKKFGQAMKLYEVWAKEARAHEESTPDGLAIKFLSAKAALEQAKRLDPDNREQREAYRENRTLASKLLQYVVRFPGEHQGEARALLAEMGGGELEPKNFAEARDRAKVALDQALDTTLSAEQQAEGRAEAIKYCRLALKLKTKDIQPDDVNVVRYYLAYLYWMDDKTYEAAVVGEFLARRYPSGTGARQGAKIAMAAYAKLLFEVPPGQDSTFERDKMVSIAKFITERWAGQPDADEAWMMLIRIAVINRDLENALAYLKNISSESVRRGEAELMTGQALWGAYLAASRLPAEQAPPADLDTMKTQAQETLKAGIERMRKPVDEGEEISYTLAASVLSVAQMAIGAGNAQEAVDWLDDPKIGAMTLVKANHPAAAKGNFPVETYKAALRAYVAADKLDQAQAAMQSLEQLVKQGGDEDAGRLTRIYISLGRQLEEQLKRLRAEGNTAEADRVSKGFEVFLTRISATEQGNNFSSLNWVAETFMGLGASLDTSPTLDPQARTKYEQAAATYRKILEKIPDAEFGAPERAEASIKIRLAKCVRRLGDFDEATDLLVQILEKRSTMLDAQIEATETYQIRGEQKPTYYLLAIKGGHKVKAADGSPALLIWGWGKIAKRVMRSSAHRQIFYQARYNLAKCRMRYGLSKKGAERKALLEQAKKDIQIVQRLYPELGGKDWYGKYDDLMKDTQEALGEKRVGLAAAAAE